MEERLTQEAYEIKLLAQDGKCAACGTTNPGKYKNFRVDRDPGTGEVRGLLCEGCAGIIAMENRFPGWIDRAIAFTQKYKRVGPVEDNCWELR